MLNTSNALSVFYLFLFFLSPQVSFGAELSNRGPTFDMDLSDFIEGDEPISYEKAQKYFSRDPSQKSATYYCHLAKFFVTDHYYQQLNLCFDVGGQHMWQEQFWC